MNKKKILNFSNYYIIPILVAIFNVLIIIVPNLVISSSKNGLLLWFNNVLPSILPFLIGTNLLINLGFVDLIGNLLEPIMRKFFGVSGCGAFSLILGMFSGYPIGAKITCELRNQNKISSYEAQRLISFTNNSGPLFIIGTVGIGMFQNVKIGYLVLAVHYLSALTLGFLFKFYKHKHKPKKTQSSLKIAVSSLKTTRLKANKSFGEILYDSVKSSLEVVSMIGGFIILFSVISEIFKSSNIFETFSKVLLPNNLESLGNGFFIGLIEITNGINLISLLKTKESVIIACSIVSFSGLSIIAQTYSLISKTDIKMSLYFLSKILHSLISFLYCIVLSPLIDKFLNEETSNVFSNFSRPILKTSSGNFLLAIIFLILLTILYKVFQKLK